jgi:hypothetical protein
VNGPLPWVEFLLATWPLWFVVAALVFLRLCGVRL